MNARAQALAAKATRRPTVLLVLGTLAGAGLAAGGLAAAPRHGQLPTGVVALVNGEPIRADDYQRTVEGVASDKRDPITDADRRHVLDRLIDEELLVQRGLALGLARQDRRVRADLTSTVIDGVVGDASERTPSDDELAAFYQRNRDFFAGPGRVRVRQVFVHAGSVADDAALGRAQQAAGRLRSGDDVATVAAALGDTPVSPLPDTLLPPSKLLEYVGPTALRAALALGDGEVSDPVRSSSGYHVLQMVERQPDTSPPLDDVRPQVLAEFRRRAGDQELRSYLDELRASAEIVVAEPLP